MKPLKTDNQSQAGLNWVWTPLFLALAVVFGMLLGMQMQDTFPRVQITKTSSEVYDEKVTGVVDEVVRFVDARFIC